MSNKTFSITFSSLEDYVDAVLYQGLVTVHLESLIHDESVGKDAPGSWRNYTIVLTARNEDEILVCRIVIGGIWTIFAKEAAGLVHSDNLVIAEKLVKAYLLMRGLSVQPGMYTLDGLNHKDLITAGANIWQFQEKRLVPRWENFPLYNGELLYREIRALHDISACLYEADNRSTCYEAGNRVVLASTIGDDVITFGPFPSIETATRIAYLVYEARQLAQGQQEVA